MIKGRMNSAIDLCLSKAEKQQEEL